MSPQAVASLEVSGDVCPRCGMMGYVCKLELSVAEDPKRTTSIEACISCLGKVRRKVRITEEIRIKDVIDLQTKARHRETRRISQKREDQASRDIGGRMVPGSGSGIRKGDARNTNWMVEDKFTTGKSYLLRRSILSKAIKQASKTGRRPVIRVGLTDGTELAVCLWSDMKEVICDQSSDDQ